MDEILHLVLLVPLSTSSTSSTSSSSSTSCTSSTSSSSCTSSSFSIFPAISTTIPGVIETPKSKRMCFSVASVFSSLADQVFIKREHIRDDLHSTNSASQLV